jgi:hypothetical protein
MVSTAGKGFLPEWKVGFPLTEFRAEPSLLRSMGDAVEEALFIQT